MKRGQPIPGSVRKEVAKRSGGFCEINLPKCGNLATEVHHRRLRSRGGSNDLKNLLHSCFSCHEKVTRMATGTKRFRTHSYQPEGVGECGFEWQPKERR